MIIRKAFRYRLYPTAVQEQDLAVQFGHSRFVYNHFLKVRQDYYAAHQNDTRQKGLSYEDTSKRLTALKQTPECEWLRQADSQVLQESLRNLERAYQAFFAGRSAYPQFKKKSHAQSIHYPQRFRLGERSVYAPKIGEIRAVIHRPLEGRPKNLTVSKTAAGRYYASIQCEIELPEPALKAGAVGIDLGLSAYATTSEGERIDPPRTLGKSQEKLGRLQRQLARKVKGSHGREKARVRLARAYEKVGDQRKDFLHKVSRSLVDRYGYIALEDLHVAGMVKNHALAGAIADASWGEFTRLLTYKGQWYGTQVEQIGRFEPSSKTCHVCGFVLDRLSLGKREWDCPACYSHHDRDENAAINILNFSRAGMARRNAGGEAGRPAVHRRGQASLKPEAQSFRIG